ncbi:hypothetical protein OG21DRAFT_1527989, partial [Imleria badia]
MSLIFAFPNDSLNFLFVSPNQGIGEFVGKQISIVDHYESDFIFSGSPNCGATGCYSCQLNFLVGVRALLWGNAVGGLAYSFCSSACVSRSFMPVLVQRGGVLAKVKRDHREFVGTTAAISVPRSTDKFKGEKDVRKQHIVLVGFHLGKRIVFVVPHQG